MDMTDTTATEVSVSAVAAHFQAVLASSAAHIALINSQPTLYPGGLPVTLDNMRKQLSFAQQQVQAAMPVATASQPPAS